MREWHYLAGSPVTEILMSARPHPNAKIDLCRLRNGNFMTSGLVFDGLVQLEFETIEGAYAQYRDWVAPEELRIIERYKS